jgi:hypothetical protein
VVSFVLPGRAPSPSNALSIGEEADLEMVMKDEAERAGAAPVRGEEPLPSRPEEH